MNRRLEIFDSQIMRAVWTARESAMAAPRNSGDKERFCEAIEGSIDECFDAYSSGLSWVLDERRPVFSENVEETIRLIRFSPNAEIDWDFNGVNHERLILGEKAVIWHPFSKEYLMLESWSEKVLLDPVRCVPLLVEILEHNNIKTSGYGNPIFESTAINILKGVIE